ncbi:hypothetical protein [Sphingopyxis sp. OAS728]|nr:hypothetical protein [Sphingopyxis sp. OAS728]
MTGIDTSIGNALSCERHIDMRRARMAFLSKIVSWGRGTTKK